MIQLILDDLLHRDGVLARWGCQRSFPDRRINVRSRVDDVSIRGRTIDHARAEVRLGSHPFPVEQNRKGLQVREKNVGNGPNRIGNIRLPKAQCRVRIHGKRSHIEMIVLAHRLIPGDGLVQSGGLVGILIFNAISVKMGTRTGCNDFPLDDVDIPPELVVRCAVASVSKRDAETELSLLVQRINRLDRRIQHVCGALHHRRVD